VGHGKADHTLFFEKKMEQENVIELKNITKDFPGIRANDDISLELRKGEIHALLGENGAGKSTLMSVLFGMYEPDEGQIFVNGKEEIIKNPNDATKLGIGMVHQHFKLVGCYTALQNIILGYEPTTKFFGFLKPKTVRKSLEDLCRKYKFKVNLDEKIDDMPVGEQQKVEILKMLFRKNDILIFDEPTAVLTPQEIEDLMQSMKELAKEGKSILFISHKLNEIMEVADRVTILRKGKCLGTLEVKNTNPQELSRLMVGRDVQLAINKKPSKAGDDVLTVKNLCVYNAEKKKDVVHDVSFNVRKGEIVCIAGIEGNGQTDLIYALTGLEKAHRGEIILHDVDSYRFLSLNKKRTEKPFFKFFRLGREYFGYGCFGAKETFKAAFIDGFRHFRAFFKKGPYEAYETKKRLSPKQIASQSRYIDAHLEDMNIRKRSLAGMSHIPEDRQKYGLALDFSLKDNLVLQRYFETSFQLHGFIKEKSKSDYAKRLIAEYDIRSSLGGSTLVRSMSGGNQQKTIVARELDRNTPLLIAVQPTRGLDVGAIESIHKQIINQRDQGSGILLVSLELDEVMNLSDRVLVMFNGEIAAELDPQKTTVNEIGLYMSGAKRMDLATHEVIFDSTKGSSSSHA
jgi:simple sugar transport system ATP-binding protein